MANRVQLEAILKFVGVEINPGLFNQISRAAAGLPGPVQQFNQNLQQSANSANAVTKGVRSVNVQLSGSERLAKLFLQRMTQFAILLPTFATLNKSIQASVKFLFDFDSAIRDIMKADVGTLGGKFDEIAKSAFKLSDEFGVSATEAANTIKTYVQAGFDLKKANELASLSILGVRASTLDAAGSVEFLLSATKQFKLEGADLAKALDALVQVEGVSASEAKDVADAFSTGGNSLAEFSKNINDSIGLIAALREQTRKSGNEIGTFFKTIQTRAFAAGESRSALESLGVQVKNLDGSLRPTMAVLQDLKTAFSGLSEEEQVTAAKTIAGTRQFEGLIATLNSLDRATELSMDAANAAGAARDKEAIDAQKLSRQYDSLIESAQKLAFTLGQNSGSSFLKSVLNDTKVLIDSITGLITLFDKLHISVLPILAPLALKGIGKVMGLGGPGAAPGGSITSTITGGGGGGTGAATQQQVAALRQLTATLNTFSAQMKVLTQATMTQSQLVSSNAALEKIRTTQVSYNTQAFQNNTRQVQAFSSSTASASKAGLDATVKYVLLTAGITAVTAIINKFGEMLSQSSSKAIQGIGDYVQSVSAAGQTAAQFSLLGKNAGMAAGAIEAILGSINKLSEAFEDNRKAAIELAQSKDHDVRLKSAPGQLSGGLQGADFLTEFGKRIAGRTKEQIHLDSTLNEAFNTLNPGTRAFIKNMNDLKETLGPTHAKETIKGFVNNDLTQGAFKNKDALEQLRKSLEGTGKNAATTAQVMDLFYKSLGMVETAATETGKVIDHTFDQVRHLQDLVNFAQDVAKLGDALDDASKSGKDFITGLDRLSLDAARASDDLDNAQRAFAALMDALTTKAATEADLNPEDAKRFIGQLKDLLDKPNSGEELDKFLSTRVQRERDFAKEYLKVEEARRKASLESAKATQAVNNELYKQSEEQRKGEISLSESATSSIAKFRTELLKLGVASGDTKLTSKISQLKGGDIKSVLGGKSDLPQEIQDLINNTFIDGVKKAEQNLKNVADETENNLTPIDKAISDLQTEIELLGNVVPNTTKATQRQTFENQIATKELEKHTVEQEGHIKALEALRELTVAQKKADEDDAKTKAELVKKTQAVTDATYNFNKSIHDINKSFQEFLNQHIEEAAQKEADAYENLKNAEQGVLGATKDLATAHRDFVATLIQVNGVLVEAKVKANLLGRDIGSLNGNIVTFADKLSSLNRAFADGMRNAAMSLEQRIQLETQLAEQTLSFLKEASDQIQAAGLNIFGQSAGENQSLQKGIAGLSYVADKLGGSFKNFEGLKPQQLDNLSKELLNLPEAFRKNILDALSFLPSTSSIGGFSVDQLKQAIGQIGAGVNPSQGLPALSDLNAQQIDQLKILGQLGTQQAKLQLTQVVVAQQQLAKAQEQLDVAKIQEDRAKQNLDDVRGKVTEELSVLDQANTERRELLQKVIAADNDNTLRQIESTAIQFADQTKSLDGTLTAIGDQVASAIQSAINAKNTSISAQSSLSTFNTIEDLKNQATGYIPNFAGGNLSPKEAGGILRAAMREKKAMPNGAQLAVANTREAIIPMHQGFIPNFASGSPGGSAIAAGIASVRNIDQTIVAAISRSVTASLSQLSGSNSNSEQLNKIASLLTDLNTNISQVKDDSSAIKANTAGFTAGSAATTSIANKPQEVRISLETSQNNTLQITGLEALRDQLRQAIHETTSKQVDKQLESLMTQLDGVFQSLQQRGLINSFGSSR